MLVYLAPQSVAHQDSAGERFAEVASRKWRWAWLSFPGTETKAHSEHRFPAPSSKASLSGTFLQSIAFRHLPPNSARFGYATEGALFISAQLSTDVVSALRKVRVLILIIMTVEAI